MEARSMAGSSMAATGASLKRPPGSLAERFWSHRKSLGHRGRHHRPRPARRLPPRAAHPRRAVGGRGGRRRCRSRPSRSSRCSASRRRPAICRYASPEQARGESLDERSLVFSVGVLLFEELTGRHPFGAVDSPRRFARIQKCELGSGVQYFPQVPAQLRTVLMKAMGPVPRGALSLAARAARSTSSASSGRAGRRASARAAPRRSRGCRRRRPNLAFDAARGQRADARSRRRAAADALPRCAGPATVEPIVARRPGDADGRRRRPVADRRCRQVDRRAARRTGDGAASAGRRRARCSARGRRAACGRAGGVRSIAVRAVSGAAASRRLPAAATAAPERRGRWRRPLRAGARPRARRAALDEVQPRRVPPGRDVRLSSVGRPATRRKRARVLRAERAARTISFGAGLLFAKDEASSPAGLPVARRAALARRAPLRARTRWSARRPAAPPDNDVDRRVPLPPAAGDGSRDEVQPFTIAEVDRRYIRSSTSMPSRPRPRLSVSRGRARQSAGATRAPPARP